MGDVRKIDRAAIETSIEAIMELVCDGCHYCYTEPSENEILTGVCEQCDTCLVESKVRELASLVEHEIAMGFGYVLADSLRDYFERSGSRACNA